MKWIEDDGKWILDDTDETDASLKLEDGRWELSAGMLDVSWDSHKEEATPRELALAITLASHVLEGFNKGYDKWLEDDSHLP